MSVGQEKGFVNCEEDTSKLRLYKNLMTQGCLYLRHLKKTTHQFSIYNFLISVLSIFVTQFEDFVTKSKHLRVTFS